VDNPKQIIQLLPKINPHLFIGVPRVFEKVFDAIQAGISEKSPLQQKLIEYAISVGDRHAAGLRNNTSLSFFDQVQYKFMDRLVLKKIRSFLGNNMKYLISGSAPMPVWLLEKYHALGILVLEAYGSSENIIPNAMNLPKAYKFGTVGRPMPENKIKLLEDGELLIKGPGMFDGYYEDTSGESIFSDDGYYPTGDYVSVDDDGFLSITGRKSEIFKTSTGRKIAPAGIEEYLRKVPYVEHAVVFGADKKFVIALVTVSPDGLARLTGQAGEKDLSKIEAKVDEQCLAAIARDITACLGPLPGFQQPAGILITGYQLNVESMDLTANLKLKRKHISERFDASIREIYRQLETGEETGRYLFNSVGRILVYYVNGDRRA
jgi:long-chain acyl-CoA synthetase